MSPKVRSALLLSWTAAASFGLAFAARSCPGPELEPEPAVSLIVVYPDSLRLVPDQSAPIRAGLLYDDGRAPAPPIRSRS